MKAAADRSGLIYPTLLAAAMMLCALPSFARDRDFDAAPAQQGGHYEARPEGGGDDEAEEAPAPVQQRPAARKRAFPRVFRARPGGIYAEPNQDTASPGVVDGVILGGAGVSQGAADKKIGQGAGSASGSGTGGSDPGTGLWVSGSNFVHDRGALSEIFVPRCVPNQYTNCRSGRSSRYDTVVAGQVWAMRIPTGSAFLNRRYPFMVVRAETGETLTSFDFAISPTVGDFSVTDPACKGTGGGSLYVYGVGSYTPTKFTPACPLTPGTLYYLNVRPTAISHAQCGASATYACRYRIVLPGGFPYSSSLRTASAKNPPPSTRIPPRAPSPVGCQWSYEAGFSPAPPAPAFACASSNAGQVVAKGTAEEFICTCR